VKLGVEVGHHMLDAGVILKAVVGQILAISASLEATMWHLSNDRDVGVDPDAAEVKGLGHTHRATVVFGPDR
jgi:hypothetical protein